MDLSKTALLLVDIQYDFIDGSLAVEDGHEVVPIALKLLDTKTWSWRAISASQDWHPHGHVSFASSHQGKNAFEAVKVKDKQGREVEQMLWPDHCVQGSRGSRLEERIMTELATLESSGVEVILAKKGTDPEMDAYSAFASDETPFPDPDKGESSPLATALRELGIERLVICGLATDYCVKSTVISAVKFGFSCVVVKDAIKAVDNNIGGPIACEEMERRGVTLVDYDDLQTALVSHLSASV